MSGSSKRVPPPLPSPKKSTPMSIKQQIALKRAEAKKATTKVKPSVNLETLEGLEDASPIGFGVIPEENIDLGRWSVKETIERARTTGEF